MDNTPGTSNVLAKLPGSGEPAQGPARSNKNNPMVKFIPYVSETPEWSGFIRSAEGKNRKYRAQCKYCTTVLSGRIETLKSHKQKCLEMPKHITTMSENLVLFRLGAATAPSSPRLLLEDGPGWSTGVGLPAAFAFCRRLCTRRRCDGVSGTFGATEFSASAASVWSRLTVSSVASCSSRGSFSSCLGAFSTSATSSVGGPEALSLSSYSSGAPAAATTSALFFSSPSLSSFSLFLSGATWGFLGAESAASATASSAAVVPSSSLFVAELVAYLAAAVPCRVFTLPYTCLSLAFQVLLAGFGAGLVGYLVEKACHVFRCESSSLYSGSDRRQVESLMQLSFSLSSLLRSSPFVRDKTGFS